MGVARARPAVLQRARSVRPNPVLQLTQRFIELMQPDPRYEHVSRLRVLGRKGRLLGRLAYPLHWRRRWFLLRPATRRAKAFLNLMLISEATIPEQNIGSRHKSMYLAITFFRPACAEVLVQSTPDRASRISLWKRRHLQTSTGSKMFKSRTDMNRAGSIYDTE